MSLIIKPEYLGLGRMHEPDERDMAFPLRAAIPKALPVKNSQYWNANGFWGDQLDTPMCVGFSWMHFLEDAPITHKGKDPIISPVELYYEAQKIDEWLGENYDGTSVRAGAKLLAHRGYITEYKWGFSLRDIVDCVLHKSPVVVGTNWYAGMYYPTPEHVINIDGHVDGGHAYIINGVNVKKRLLRIKNSWGRKWGNNGLAYITFENMERLIQEDGEVCLAVEKHR